MTDLISRSELIKQFPQNMENPLWHFTGIRAAIEAAPAIDAVPVIRCKDCIRWGFGKMGEPEYAKTCAYAQWIVGANDYCSNAMRKCNENQID